MPDFVLVTHTRWMEAPRIRHQVARLLRDAGHRVLFVERADYPWSGPSPAAVEVEPGITLTRTTRLIHHQFRVIPAMHRLDASHVARRLRNVVDRWRPAPDFMVVNFTHDGWFLRETFPGQRIVTVIHDDFEAQSRLPFSGHIAWTLERTCRSSDTVLAVSEPLRERLSRSISQSDDNVELSKLVRSLYREWKSQLMDEQIDDLAYTAYGRGALAGLTSDTKICWKYDPAGPACPDAEDNALAGPIDGGDAFPTGHTHAPAHSGCRCVIVPVHN